jgi:transposase-like protein
MPAKPHCPRCRSIVVVKSGRHHGKQRWLCKRCRYQFTSPDLPVEASDQTKRVAVTLYGHGLSFRCVAKLLATSAHSVIRWVTVYIDTCCSKPAPEGTVIIEVDEMWHFLGSKANKLWIWTALDRASGRLIVIRRAKLGSSFFCVHILAMKIFYLRVLCGSEDSPAQKFEAGATVHGSLDDLQPVDLPLDRTGAPGQRQGGMDGLAVLTQAAGKPFEAVFLRGPNPIIQLVGQPEAPPGRVRLGRPSAPERRRLQGDGRVGGPGAAGCRAVTGGRHGLAPWRTSADH